MNNEGSFNQHLLTRKEAAHYLHISPGTLAVWDSTKRYPELKSRKIGRSVRYRRADLDEFIERRLRS